MRSPGAVAEAKVKIFKCATDCYGAEIGIECRHVGVKDVEDLADPIKLSVDPSAPAVAFRP